MEGSSSSNSSSHLTPPSYGVYDEHMNELYGVEGGDETDLILDPELTSSTPYGGYDFEEDLPSAEGNSFEANLQQALPSLSSQPMSTKIASGSPDPTSAALPYTAARSPPASRTTFAPLPCASGTSNAPTAALYHANPPSQQSGLLMNFSMIPAQQIHLNMTVPTYAYAPANNPKNTADITSFFYAHRFFSEGNLPYELSAIQASAIPGIHSPYAGCPTQLCSKIEDWRLELILVTNPFMSIIDLVARMNVQNDLKPSTQALSNRVQRYREKSGRLSNPVKYTVIGDQKIRLASAAATESMLRLTPEQIERRTCWELFDDRYGNRKVRQPRTGAQGYVGTAYDAPTRVPLSGDCLGVAETVAFLQHLKRRMNSTLSILELRKSLGKDALGSEFEVYSKGHLASHGSIRLGQEADGTLNVWYCQTVQDLLE